MPGRSKRAWAASFSSQRYNHTTINTNLLDPANKSRRFDQLAVVNAIGAGETIDLGNIGIDGLLGRRIRHRRSMS